MKKKIFSATELAKQAEQYKKLYPKAKKMYCTPDGNFFLDWNSARNHARTAKLELFEVDMKAETTTAKEVDINKPVVATKEEATTTTLKPAQDPDPKAEAKKALFELDFSKPDDLDYYKVKEYLTTLGFSAESNKKEDVFKAAENLQVQLKEEAE